MQQPPPQGQEMIQGQMQDTANDCLNCHSVCLDAASSLLQQGNGHAEHIRTMLDCSEICLTTAHFMIRNSPLYGYVCQACTEICTHCGEMCEQIGEQDCANACRVAASSCQQMVKMVI